MRGSVVRRGDRWYVKVELDPDPVTGRRRQRWHSGYATKKDAERDRVDLLSRLDRGDYVEPTRQSVADFLAEWFPAIQPTVRPATFNSYERNVRNHVVPYIGSTRLTKVDAGVLNGLYAKLLLSGRRPHNRAGAGYPPEVLRRAVALRRAGMTLKDTAAQLREEVPAAAHITKDTLASLLRRASATPAALEGIELHGLDHRTVAYVHVILHRVFKDAVRWGRLTRNPADAADPPRVGSKAAEMTTWDAATLRRFLARSVEEGDRLHGLWVLLATTGMRRGEAIGLRWSDVDLDSGRARVVQTVIQSGSEVLIGEPKTTQGRRPVALDPATVAELRAHRRRMLEERLLVGADFHDEGWIFHRPDGTRLRPDATSYAFVRRVERYGLPRLTLHGLRHTWATLALEKGIHPRVVQERLGHSTIAITLGTYSHVSPALHAEAAQVVADLLFDHQGT